MRGLLGRSIGVATLLAVIAWPWSAHACQCAQVPGPRTLDPSQLASEVEVLDVIKKETDDRRTEYGRLRVVRAWTGPKVGETVDVQSLAGSCSYFFKKGATLFVYAHTDGLGGWETNACAVFEAEAAQREIALLPAPTSLAGPKTGGCAGCSVDPGHTEPIGALALASVVAALLIRRARRRATS